MLERVASTVAKTDDSIDCRLGRLLTSPDLLPMNIDPASNSLLLFKMTKQDYVSSPFLTSDRAIRSSLDAYTLCLDEILNDLRNRAVPRPVHYILHGTLCCSTLLSRYLENRGHYFVLREPAILAQVAFLCLKSGDAVPSSVLDDYLHMCRHFLSRTYDARDTAIIKVNDLCNWQAKRLLTSDSRSRLIFISGSLEGFVVSTLKAKHRPPWVRNRLATFEAKLRTIPFLKNVRPVNLSDGQCAAALWLIYSFLCRSLLSGLYSDRILVLTDEDVVYRFRDTLQRIDDFLRPSQMNVDDMAEVGPFARYAKDLNLAYDATTRAEDLERACARFKAESAAAVTWALDVADEWLNQAPFAICMDSVIR